MHHLPRLAALVLLLAATARADSWGKFSDGQLIILSHFVVVGRIQDDAKDAGNDWKVATLKVSQQFYADDAGGFTSSFPLRFATADVEGASVKYEVGQEGVWFVEETPDGFDANYLGRFRKLDETDAVKKTVQTWLSECITNLRESMLEPAYKKDPTGDSDVCWKTMQHICILGSNEATFPRANRSMKDSPVRDRLADLYKMFGEDLGLPPYPTTDEEKKAAIAALRPHFSAAVIEHLEKPRDDADLVGTLDMTYALYLNNRATLVREILAGDAESVAGMREDLKRRAPDEPWDKAVSRVDLFKAALRLDQKNPQKLY